jgi:hypothetical protein
MFLPENNKETGRRRKLHNEELHNVHFSPNTNIIIMLNEYKMKGAVGDTKYAYKFKQKNVQRRNDLRDPGVN